HLAVEGRALVRRHEKGQRLAQQELLAAVEKGGGREVDLADDPGQVRDQVAVQGELDEFLIEQALSLFAPLGRLGFHGAPGRAVRGGRGNAVRANFRPDDEGLGGVAVCAGEGVCIHNEVLRAPLPGSCSPPAAPSPGTGGVSWPFSRYCWMSAL